MLKNITIIEICISTTLILVLSGLAWTVFKTPATDLSLDTNNIETLILTSTTLSGGKSVW